MPEFLVLGGDLAALHHVRQLERAFGGSAVRVVDADWQDAIRRWVPRAAPDDQLVPAPTMPHLLRRWLAAEVGAAPAETPRGWGLPFEVAGDEGEVYLSAAAWTCPATCIEPAHCPVLHGPRDWDLAAVISGRAVELGYEPVVFPVRHYAAGVATIPAAALQAALGIRAPRLLVATSSHCHAAVGALRAPVAGKLSDGP
ncbi:MAG TPA: hypothetical protein VIP52_03615 [Candidatus Dormibacteraeota bacterium]